jgi:nitrogen fixation NifU-like protein
MDSNLRRAIILENYSNPFNKGLINDDDYIKVNVNNESCIDNIDLMLKIRNGVIEDMRFDGEACAISTSATSIMIRTLLHKTVDEALEVINEYEKMIDEEQYNVDVLGEAVVYDEIYKQPNRKKCALLPVKGIKKVLEANK